MMIITTITADRITALIGCGHLDGVEVVLRVIDNSRRFVRDCD